ncbi:MAG: hypothetical protein ABI550_09910, partial [Ignavibacteriaceae bacterium]
MRVKIRKAISGIINIFDNFLRLIKGSYFFINSNYYKTKAPLIEKEFFSLINSPESKISKLLKLNTHA